MFIILQTCWSGNNDSLLPFFLTITQGLLLLYRIRSWGKNGQITHFYMFIPGIPPPELIFISKNQVPQTILLAYSYELIKYCIYICGYANKCVYTHRYLFVLYLIPYLLNDILANKKFCEGRFYISAMERHFSNVFWNLSLPRTSMLQTVILF